MFKLYAALALIVALTCGGLWHKHVVAQRDEARRELVAVKADLKRATDAVTASEKFRHAEFEAGKQALQRASDDCTARVAEARRSAQAIKTIVEKPRATDPITHCPVPDRVPVGELRDALQPHPFSRAGTPAAR